LVTESKIRPRTKWKHIYPLFANDDRYINILGNPGSNPLELFWDVVDSLDQKLEAKVAIVEGAINRHNERLKDGDGMHVDGDSSVFKVGPNTTEDAFLEIIKADDDPEIRQLSLGELKEIFHSVSIHNFLGFTSSESVVDARSDVEAICG
jgi:pre-mRNA-processing factor 40